MFDLLLDQVDVLNSAAIELPRRTRSRRLRMETAVIVGLAIGWREGCVAATRSRGG